MRGSKSILALVILLLAFGAVSAAAQDYYAKTINKTGSVAIVIPPTGTVKYNTIAYCFTTELTISVAFETVDLTRVKLAVKATLPVPTACMVQWETFAPILLNLGTDGTGTFILNTETGYAEK